MDRPITTLFLLISVDGKISTGSTDEMDYDKDLAQLPDVVKGLQQYYDIQQTTDLWSLNSGKTHRKMGRNEAPMPEKTVVNYVLIDNKNLNEHGIDFFCHQSNKFVLITTNKDHPAYNVQADNMHIIQQEQLDLREAFRILKENLGCERLTIETGGQLNGILLRNKLIDFVDVIVAPMLVGGKDTPTLIDGRSLVTPTQLWELGTLKLESAETLNDSYVRLRYKVLS